MQDTQKSFINISIDYWTMRKIMAFTDQIHVIILATQIEFEKWNLLHFDEIQMQLIKVLWEKPESFEANEISTFKEEFKTYLAIISPSKTWQRRKYNEED